MAIVEINRDPNSTELRIFAVAQLFFFAVVSVAVYRTFDSWIAAAILLPLATVTAAVGLMVPNWLRRFYIAWMTAVAPLSWLMSHVVLAVVYYGAITPIGLLMRLCRHDPMNREFDADATSYWVPRTTANGVDRYFRQF